MSDAPAVLQTEHLTARYGPVVALHDVTIAFRINRIHALIGPSGCGKSTLLRTLNRMHEVTEGATVSGRVLLDGHDIYDPRVSPMQLRRQVGMVFQRPTPFPTMSIYQNVAAGLRLQGRVSRTEMDARVEQALQEAGLWGEVADRLRRSPMALSGGQQQRLCLARTLAPRPEVILLDEPTASLDPRSTQRIEELLVELRRDYTIVIVTHNMQQAARISDETALLDGGELIEAGPTARIFTAPEDPRTDAYLTGRFG
ncbi:MAG TPA: phosphate ABC transporter ATP-binding protein PstB [Gemmatimonadales bacterium]|nr:phosphate ABC transporter ATP-binding protein PstB [Gemmatimonadales bacterium]